MDFMKKFRQGTNSVEYCFVKILIPPKKITPPQSFSSPTFLYIDQTVAVVVLSANGEPSVPELELVTRIL